MMLLSEGYEATKELRDSLSHVQWIGGASDSSLVPILRYIPRCTEG